MPSRQLPICCLWRRAQIGRDGRRSPCVFVRVQLQLSFHPLTQLPNQGFRSSPIELRIAFIAPVSKGDSERSQTLQVVRCYRYRVASAFDELRQHGKVVRTREVNILVGKK